MTCNHHACRCVKDELLHLRYFYHQIRSAKDRYEGGDIGHGSFINAICGALQGARMLDEVDRIDLSFRNISSSDPLADRGNSVWRDRGEVWDPSSQERPGLDADGTVGDVQELHQADGDG